VSNSNPWDPLPPEPKGDATADAIYFAVGRALNKWEVLGFTIGEIFGALVGAANQSSARVAFGTIASFEMRRQMVEAAAQITLAEHAQLLTDLKTALSEAGNLSARRNDIAHGMVTDHSSNEKNLGHYLEPSWANSKKIGPLVSLKKGPKHPSPFEQQAYAYTAAQIGGYAHHFSACASKLVLLHNKIVEMLAPPSPQ
jgi:hypothetical protein